MDSALKPKVDREDTGSQTASGILLFFKFQRFISPSSLER